MVQANSRYTAKEIVVEAGLDPDVFGEVGIEIGGIKGIVSPRHIIRVTDGTETLDVRVGDQFVTLTVDAGGEEPFISEGAREILDQPV